MAKFRVKAPDGSEWEINAPDGADEDAVLRYAQMQFKAQAAEAPQDFPQEDPGFGQSALIGAGRTLDRLGKGVKQMGLNVASAVGSDRAKAELGRMDAMETDASRQYAKLQELRPGATMLGEAAPLVAAPMLGAGVAGTAASAAIPGLIEYGTGQERLTRGALGATGGAG